MNRSIGRPPRSARTFPGSRVEPTRAWMTQSTASGEGKNDLRDPVGSAPVDVPPRPSSQLESSRRRRADQLEGGRDDLVGAGAGDDDGGLGGAGAPNGPPLVGRGGHRHGGPTEQERLE